MTLRDELRARVAEHRKRSEARGANRLLREGDGPEFAKTMAEQAQDCGGGPVQAPLRERLVNEQMALSRRLLAVEDALEALDENPDYEKHAATSAKLQAAGYYS